MVSEQAKESYRRARDERRRAWLSARVLESLPLATLERLAAEPNPAARLAQLAGAAEQAYERSRRP